MKHILFLLLLSSSLYGQTNQSTPYSRKMDSTAIANFHIKYTEASEKTYEECYILHKIKLTFATRINSDDLSYLGLDLDGEATEDDFHDASTDDYLSIFKYDLRSKFYITRDIRFLTRVVIMGTKYQTNQYSSGFLINF